MAAVGEFAGSIRPLRRVEYDRMVELGLFENEKVELLRGCSAGVPEHWVVDTAHGLIEVRTAIVNGVYSQVTPYRAGQDIALGAFSDVTLAVADILG